MTQCSNGLACALAGWLMANLLVTSGWAQNSGVSRPGVTARGPAAASPGLQARPPAAPQGAGQPLGAPRQQARPPAQALEVPPLDPAMEAILVRWERESAKITVLKGEHECTEYNKVFSVEKRSKGMFYYEAPDKGRFDMQGIPVEPGAKSLTKNPDTGEAYDVATGTDQGWICTGQEILILTPTAKQFEVHPIPAEMQGEKIVQSPLPFLFGLKADEAKRRFELTLRGENAKTNSYIIDVRPLLPMDAQNYKQATISLSKANFVPNAVQLVDPAGTLLTKYVFRDVEVNPKPGAIASLLPFFKDEDPFRPNLRGWKRVQNPGVQPASNEMPADDRSRGRAQVPVQNGFPNQARRNIDPSGR